MMPMVYKELLVHRTLILYYLAIVLPVALRLIPVDGPLAIIATLAMAFTSTTAMQDNRDGHHLVINSLPVSRAEVVAGKYAFYLATGLAFIGFGTMAGMALGTAAAQPGWIAQALGSAVVFTVFVAVFFPAYYLMPPRFVQLGFFLGLIALFTVMPTLYNLGVKRGFWGLPELIGSLPPAGFYGALAAGTLLLLTASWRASVAFYQRKEF